MSGEGKTLQQSTAEAVAKMSEEEVLLVRQAGKLLGAWARAEGQRLELEAHFGVEVEQMSDEDALYTLPALSEDQWTLWTEDVDRARAEAREKLEAAQA